MRAREAPRTTDCLPGWDLAPGLMMESREGVGSGIRTGAEGIEGCVLREFHLAWLSPTPYKLRVHVGSDEPGSSQRGPAGNHSLSVFSAKHPGSARYHALCFKYRDDFCTSRGLIFGRYPSSWRSRQLEYRYPAPSASVSVGAGWFSFSGVSYLSATMPIICANRVVRPGPSHRA